jgi:hypothetical protein
MPAGTAAGAGAAGAPADGAVAGAAAGAARALAVAQPEQVIKEVSEATSDVRFMREREIEGIEEIGG